MINEIIILICSFRAIRDKTDTIGMESDAHKNIIPPLKGINGMDDG